MTLVVADVFADDQIALVSDTLVTWDPGERVATPGTEELAKLVILRDDLAVGVSGTDPHGRIRDAIAMRDSTVEDVISMLEEDPYAAFIVARLDPVGLWQIEPGRAVEVTARGHAWSGDEAAHDDEYLPRFNREFLNDPLPFRQMTAMQALTSFRRAATIGGRALRVVTDEGRFRFAADAQYVLGVEDSAVAVGEAPTPGAVGVFYAHLGTGGLFRHEAPDLPVRIDARSIDEFCELASVRHGQTLRAARFA